MIGNSTRQIYFVITIDTECDKGAAWVTQKPLQFKAVTEAIPNQFEPLFQKYHAKATYLLSPEVIKNDKCVKILKTVHSNGAELGTHLHGEFIEPLPEYEAKITSRMQNTYSKEIEYAKLKNLTSLFQHTFGFPPISFRAGRFGISNHTFSILSELGYKVDSSVAPYCEWSEDSGKTSFWGFPTHPYYPNYKDNKKKGDLPVLVVPVTIGNTWYEYVPDRILETIPNHPRLWGIPLKYLKLKKFFQPIWLRPTFTQSTVDNMKTLMLRQLKRNTNQNVFFVMMFHNVDFVPGCSPYARTALEAQHLFDRLENILSFAENLPVRFITLSKIGELIQNERAIQTAIQSENKF